VLTTVLILIGMAVGLGVLFWAGAVGLQNFYYNDPAPDLYWRAPAAALALTAFLGIWFWIDHRSPGTLGTLISFTSSEDVEFTDLYWIKKDKTEVHYRRNAKGVFVDTQYPDRRWVHSTADEMVEEMRAQAKTDDPVIFKVELTPEGKLTDPVRYIEQGGKGRVMTEENLGHVSSSKGGVVLLNWLWSGLFYGVCFLCIWLLLRFQWPHALALAVPIWLAFTVIMPFLLSKPP
jgi:hypothetical protein